MLHRLLGTPLYPHFNVGRAPMFITPPAVRSKAKIETGIQGVCIINSMQYYIFRLRYVYTCCDVVCCMSYVSYTTCRCLHTYGSSALLRLVRSAGREAYLLIRKQSGGDGRCMLVTLP